MQVPVYPLLPPNEGQGLLDKQYAARRWATYGGKTQQEVDYGVPPGVDFLSGAGSLGDDPGTTHLVVIDKWQNMVRYSHWLGFSFKMITCIATILFP